MSDRIVINQVLMFKDQKTSSELGQSLWSAMKEVEAFYNHGIQRAEFRRTFLSEYVPEYIESQENGFLGIGKFWDFLLKRGSSKEEGEKDKERHLEYKSEASWKMTRGKFPQTYDTEKVISLVRELLEEDWKDDIPIIVIDKELTPPPNWRYIIWDSRKKGIVISTVPTDPEYWRMHEPNRNAVIKHRIRTACMQIVGRLLKLNYCSNEKCFLYQPVDSVIRLDRMVELGHEHKHELGQEMKIDELLECGYEIIVGNPQAKHSLKQKPKPILEE